PLQEFTYDSRANSLRPTSAPVVSGQTAGSSPMGFELATYDAAGNLWAAQSRPGSLAGGALVAYLSGKGRARLSSGEGAARPEWATAQWWQPCRPGGVVTRADGLGVPRSLDTDPRSGAVILTTMTGIVLPVVPDGASSTDFTAGRIVDLGLDWLVDRNRFAVLPRKGALDA